MSIAYYDLVARGKSQDRDGMPGLFLWQSSVLRKFGRIKDMHNCEIPKLNAIRLIPGNKDFVIRGKWQLFDFLWLP